MERSGVIVGTACDAEQELPGVLVQVERVAALFAQSAVVFWESDSKDGTRAVLQAFIAQRPSQRRLVTRNNMKRLPRWWNDRVGRIGHARRRLLEVVRADPELRTFEFLVVMDLDEVSSYVDVDAAAAILRLPPSAWGVATANQVTAPRPSSKNNCTHKSPPKAPTRGPVASAPHVLRPLCAAHGCAHRAVLE